MGWNLPSMISAINQLLEKVALLSHHGSISNQIMNILMNLTLIQKQLLSVSHHQIKLKEHALMLLEHQYLHMQFLEEFLVNLVLKLHAKLVLLMRLDYK
jgi:hypothetical protein